MFVAWDEVRYTESFIASNETRIRKLDNENREIEKELVRGDGDEDYRKKRLNRVKRNTAEIATLTNENYEHRLKRSKLIDHCLKIRGDLIDKGFSTTRRCHF